MKRIPVQIQLFMILFLVLVIPMSIISYYSSASMMSYSEQEIADSALLKLDSGIALNEFALNNVIVDVLQMVKENKFNTIKNITSYTELTSDYDTVNSAVNILNSMNEILSNDSTVYSIIFYLDNADYAISTNKGIVRLKYFESMDWLEAAMDKINGAGGVWFPRVLNKATVTEIEKGLKYSESINVISYVYRLNRLTTSTKGTIIVNVNETKVSSFLNSNKHNSDSTGFITDMDGNVISHKDKSLIHKNLSEVNYVKDILKNKADSGYFYVNTENERILYTFYKTPFNHWIYITTYSMDTLLEKSNVVRTNFMILTIVIIAIGTVITVLVSIGFSKPMKQLVNSMKKQAGFEDRVNKNELAYLTTAFEKIREQEDGLNQLLKEREKETKYLAFHNLLTGEIANSTEMEEIKKAFPYSHYIVALVSVDNIKSYLKEANPETRSYQRYLLFDKFENAFPEEYHVCCARYEAGTIAIIINMEYYDHIRVPRTLKNVLNQIKTIALEVRGYTVTIGVSGVHNSYGGIKECVYEAAEAVKQRLLAGRNSIIFWESEKRENKKFHYFYNSEKKILNFLNNGDFESLKSELRKIVNQIKEEKDISYDNILLIFNQLVGATIKFLVEHNINTSKIFRSNINIYSEIAGLDTVDEIEAYLTEIFKSIMDYTAPSGKNNETKYCEQIFKYLREHYKEDIILEDIAEKVGISYSYLRKLIKEETGKSLNDNVNILRIEEVKNLLLHSDLNISQIAKEVGYRNIQSVIRFFKKYEGISPSEFKNLKQEESI
ncbi:helix-turn-helix domain-containing protein [Anaerocolumna sedimenticola]|uniref:Helix-turn-helix domain-containing protein n=1 Tax=Anaerocolumna sedimenticola TaxID=2696063 RepID=A0A6P1TJ44_9FIRM|nr:helix-turn-helix domain-containing protein [Anaerocolumna sedimenticola]QHQ59936.1 helix-turn-helix domain-containing protein [Anaerocolumna sedimenticola]